MGKRAVHASTVISDFFIFPQLEISNLSSHSHSLPRKNFVHHAARDRTPERPRDSRQERQKRFVDLRPLRLLRQEVICQPLNDGHTHSDQDHPAPRLARAQESEQHVRRQHHHRRQQQIAYFDVQPPCQYSRQHRHQIIKAVAARLFLGKNLTPSCSHNLYLATVQWFPVSNPTSKCKIRARSCVLASQH